MTTYTLRIHPDPVTLARQAAEQVASVIDLALAERDRAQIALCGGQTPRSAYTQLGAEHLPWERVDVLLGDERFVPPDHPDSNARMIRESLLLQEPARHACFHPVPTEGDDPEIAASAYSATLEQLCPGNPPCFDLMLLGLGDDGHTASLFPGTAAATVQDRWVTLGLGKGLPRITLTAPVLSAARQVIFLVSGAAKQEALQRLLDPAEKAERTPAKAVRPRSTVLVLADADAAGDLQAGSHGA